MDFLGEKMKFIPLNHNQGGDDMRSYSSNIDEDRASRHETKKSHSGHFRHGSARSYKSSENQLSVDILETERYPPWVDQRRVYRNDAIDMLLDEIKDFIAFIEPKPCETRLKELTVQRISHVSKALWSKSEASVFGSFSVGLDLPTSDIDIAIISDHVSKTDRPGIARSLRELSQALHNRGISEVGKTEVITATRIPIVKYVDSITGIRVDVSLNSGNGIEAAKYVKKFVGNSNFGLAVKYLVIIVKQFLFQRNLSTVFLGGLGGYAVFLLVHNFLKMHPIIQCKLADPLENLGTLTIEFFELYGSLMNTSDVAIGVLPNGEPYYCQLEDTKVVMNSRRGGICIIDPLDPTNDIGKGTFAWGKIRSEFFKAYKLMEVALGEIYLECNMISERNNASGQYKCVTTLLGLIIDVDANSLDIREFSERRWREIKILCKGKPRISDPILISLRVNDLKGIEDTMPNTNEAKKLDNKNSRFKKKLNERIKLFERHKVPDD